MATYNQVSEALLRRMEEEKKDGSFLNLAFDERNAVRRTDDARDKANVWRTAFIRDIDKILYCPYYSRYTDKTQVFSLYKNDDITHRSLHVQLVSRIARTLGKALNLNCDLIEAIALGHDIGHTPFGHSGEKFLDSLYSYHTGRHFTHSVHSVRVLDTIFPLNLSLQTLDGIAAHNGEMELEAYLPKPLNGFEEFDGLMEKCYQDAGYIKNLIPCTLEGCVVRISDIIAYLGKDRQDAETGKILSANDFDDHGIGVRTPEIVNNLMVNILEHSYGHPYIKMDSLHFEALQKGKLDNYEIIYGNKQVKHADDAVEMMMAELYERLLYDLKEGITNSPIFRHHIKHLNSPRWKDLRQMPYEETEKNLLVVDYIASMTDDYLIDLHAYLFPKSTHKIKYIGYFD